jgi:hypothetical protein
MMLREGNCFAHWHIGFTLAGKPCLRSDTCKDEEAMDIDDRVARRRRACRRVAGEEPLVVFNTALLLVTASKHRTGPRVSSLPLAFRADCVKYGEQACPSTCSPRTSWLSLETSAAANFFGSA